VPLVVTLVACNDLRDFRTTWQGARVGDTPVLRVGAGDAATLVIDQLDGHGLHGTLTVDGLLPATELTSLPGAEADVLSDLTFAGSPLRVFLAFVAVPDAGGEAIAMVALYDDHRVELRVLRGGAKPVYAIYQLTSDR